jgi:hypothetical protein
VYDDLHNTGGENVLQDGRTVWCSSRSDERLRMQVLEVDAEVVQETTE